MPESDFERRLGTLLRQTAADIPPEMDVTARVHQRYYATGSRRWMAAASMVAVVALLAGTFALFRGAGLLLGPGPITLHVDGAYGDATATVVTFHLTGPRTDVAYTPGPLSLTDAAGNSLLFQSGGGGASGGEFALFAPLPQPALSVRQTLTLTITMIDLRPLHVTDGSMPTETTVKGFWVAPVTVLPIAGTSTLLEIPAQTHGKLTIQPLRLDVSPGTRYAAQYLPGGLRIVLRVSGLTPGTPPSVGLATKAYPTDPNAPPPPDAPTSGDQSSLSTAGDHPNLHPGILPAFVFALDAQGVLQQVPANVDASGAVEFELIYVPLLALQGYLPGLSLRGPLTLTIDSITLSAGETVHGPWVFTIPFTFPNG